MHMLYRRWCTNTFRHTDTLSVFQIVTEQHTGQKIQIVTALDSTVPKQQFILAAPDGFSAGKVLLASPDCTSAKQLIFATADSLVPGQIQV